MPTVATRQGHVDIQTWIPNRTAFDSKKVEISTGAGEYHVIDELDGRRWELSGEGRNDELATQLWSQKRGFVQDMYDARLGQLSGADAPQQAMGEGWQVEAFKDARNFALVRYGNDLMQRVTVDGTKGFPLVAVHTRVPDQRQPGESVTHTMTAAYKEADGGFPSDGTLRESLCFVTGLSVLVDGQRVEL